MQSRLEQETLTVSQIPVERYPFAVSRSASPLPPSQERDHRSTKHTTVSTAVKIATSTNTNISTGAKSTNTTTVPTNSTISTGARSSRDATSRSKKHGERITSFAVGLPPPSPSAGGRVNCLLFVNNDQDVMMGLENDIIGVKILLASPHLGSLRTRAEALKKTLLQLKELVDLLSQCQDQVRLHVGVCVMVIVNE